MIEEIIAMGIPDKDSLKGIRFWAKNAGKPSGILFCSTAAISLFVFGLLIFFVVPKVVVFNLQEWAGLCFILVLLLSVCSTYFFLYRPAVRRPKEKKYLKNKYNQYIDEQNILLADKVKKVLSEYN